MTDFCVNCGDQPTMAHELNSEGLCINCTSPDHYAGLCPSCQIYGPEMHDNWDELVKIGEDLIAMGFGPPTNRL